MTAELDEVLLEFGGSRVSLAAEVVRLRQRLEELGFDLSRAAAHGISGLLIDPMPPVGATPRPIGFRPNCS